MCIEVEIGNQQQKDQIKEEISIICDQLLNPTWPSYLTLNKIIVTNNFDETVRSISNTKNYESIRVSNETFAKIIYEDDSYYIIFSGKLYTDEFDNATRLFFFFHELRHIINANLFPLCYKLSPAQYELHNYSQQLFDEYVADMFSFIYQEKYMVNRYGGQSGTAEKYIISTPTSFSKNVNDPSIYEKLQIHIDEFWSHQDINKLIDQNRYIIDSTLKSLIHGMSYCDFFLCHESIERMLTDSPVYTKSAEQLLDSYRVKFINNDYNVLDTLCLMDDILRSFGLGFVDTKEGLAFEVVDLDFNSA